MVIDVPAAPEPGAKVPPLIMVKLPVVPVPVRTLIPPVKMMASARVTPSPERPPKVVPLLMMVSPEPWMPAPPAPLLPLPPPPPPPAPPLPPAIVPLLTTVPPPVK
jgi:hypothetical protein